MTLMPTTPVDPSPVPTILDPLALRRRALKNVLRAGHCAPTIMKTLADSTGVKEAWPVKLAAGLPGIGNSGNECGAITAPLIILGLRHSGAPAEDGVPVVVSKGRALLKDFQARHGTHACRDILVLGRVPLRCIGIVRRAPEQALEIDRRPCAEALSGQERAACALLHAHLTERCFHCAHAVLRESAGANAIEPALLDATSGFVGGTAYAGLTCSALTAGVMLLGLVHSEGEHRPGRVFRAMVGMASGGHAFPADFEAINGPLDEGHELAKWFESQFGSTQCRDLTGADFSTTSGARQYIESDGVSRCQAITTAVAARVREMTGPAARPS